MLYTSWIGAEQQVSVTGHHLSGSFTLIKFENVKSFYNTLVAERSATYDLAT